MNQPTTRWSISKKIGFRFIFIYLGLHIFPFIITYIPYSNYITAFYTDGRRSLILWVGEHILNVGKLTIFPAGSGDTTYNYVEIFTFFMLAVIGVIIWSVLDRRRSNYSRLLRFFSVYVSYYVAVTMLSYGFAKVFYLQFSSPSLVRLLQPYGDSSPMGIAWTFMGASKTYTMFSGFAEVIGGLLLFFRRTRTFGSILIFGVMFNVFMMNMSYDIPVKLYSFHLLLMMLFVMLLDYQRIVNLIGLKKPLTIRNVPGKFFETKRKNMIMMVFKVVFVCYASYLMVNNNWTYAESRNNKPDPVIYGIFDVNTYVVNKDTLPPLLTDTVRWKKLIFDNKYGDYVIAKGMDDKDNWFKYEIDTLKNSIAMTSTRDSTNVYNFNFVLKDSTLVFDGFWKQDTLKLKMDEFDLTKFRLTNRGFHWVNEYPFNR